jgi:FAD/FMN-containing dehydrogenase/Fe-S oxidoreductase
MTRTEAAPQHVRTTGEDDSGPVEGLAAELERRVEGEVRFDRGSRRLYSFDASVYRQTPIGVVIPRSDADVEATLDVCRRHGAPVLPRGCGTSLAGQCCNVAVVLDFSKYMNRILELDPDRRIARVQPGVICDQLRDAAEEHGLTFAPDPATHDHCTLGGMIGNNSCGTHSVMGGKTVDNTIELEVLTYDGLRLRVGATGDRELEGIIAAGGRRGEIYAALRSLGERYADEVRHRYPDIPRRVSGYNLDELLPERDLNLARALVGTEGTCVVVLEATVRLVPSPRRRTLVVLGYPDIPSSGRHMPEILAHGPIGVEFFSRHVLENLEAKGMRFGGEALLPPGDAFVLVEFGGASQEEADGPAGGMVEALGRLQDGPRTALYNTSEQETAVWEIRRHSAGTTRMPLALGGHPGWPNWEDAAVPPERLGDYLADQLQLLRRYGYDGVFYGHWGQGCVHCRIDFDLRTAQGIARFRRFMEDAADLVVAYGGSLSGEHGDGHGRAELLPRMFGPRLVQAFKEFKGIWDPGNRMNPGKLVDPYPLDEHLREGTGYRPAQVATKFAFPVDGGSFAEAAGRCFGVGKCRHVEGGTMCPSFMVTREERHSTRGRARLLQEMLESPAPAGNRWRDPDVKEALDLCLACKGCKGDCPVQVDMATYKAEFLSHWYQGRPRPRAAYAMGLIQVWARLAARAPAAVNAVAHAPVLGRLVKLGGGIAPQRALPHFAPRTFTDWFAARAPRNPDGPPVLLWPDTFNNHFTPEVAVAATEVLESAGFQVRVPAAWLCCGRPLYDYGMLDTARRYLRRTLETLAGDVRAGVPVVGLEPSCVAVLRDELKEMLPHDQDGLRLSAQTFTLGEFLAQRAPDWRPPRLDRKALVQVHCHHGAIMGFDHERELLARMGVDAELPDSGCCGMAGSFGYERGERYEVSMACGERVILPRVRQAGKDTLILADGFSCREQLAAATDRRPLHLAQAIRLGMEPEDQRFAADYPERSVPARLDGREHASRAAVLAIGAGLSLAGCAAAVRRLRRGG